MSFSNEAPGHLMISPHFSILISAKDNLQIFSLLMSWTRTLVSAPFLRKREHEPGDKLHNGKTHLSHQHQERWQSSAVIMFASQDAIHPCLPSHGNAGQMSDRCFKVHHNGPFPDRRSSFIHTHTRTNTQAFKTQPSSTTFYRCRKDALASFSTLAARRQMKR